MRFEGFFPTPSWAPDHVPFAVIREGWCEFTPENLVVFGKRCRSSLPTLVGFVVFVAAVALYAWSSPVTGGKASKDERWLYLLLPITIAAVKLTWDKFGASKKQHQWNISWSRVKGYFIVLDADGPTFHLVVGRTILYFIPDDSEGFSNGLNQKLSTEGIPTPGIRSTGGNGTSRHILERDPYRTLVFATSYNGALSRFMVLAALVFLLFLLFSLDGWDAFWSWSWTGQGFVGFIFLSAAFMAAMRGPLVLLFPALSGVLRTIRRRADEIQSVRIESSPHSAVIFIIKLDMDNDKTMALKPRNDISIPRLLSCLEVLLPGARVSWECNEMLPRHTPPVKY